MIGGRSRRTSERGAAAVEFALIAPLILLLFFGIISYGYLLSFRQAISQGAAEGARAAAVTPANFTNAQRDADAKAAINQALGSYGVSCTNGATCTVTPPAACTAGVGDCVKVTVSYPYKARPLIPALPFVPLPTNLSYTAEVRVS